MKIISRNYGVTDNHVKYVTIKGSIEQRLDAINDCIYWKANDDWGFEFIKYEHQDHFIVRFDGMDDAMFIVKSLDYSEHTICDYLYKEDSNEYVKWILLIHLTKLFEKSPELPDFKKYNKVFQHHIQMY